MFNQQDGEKLVKLARRTVEKYFENGKLVLEECKQKNFLEKHGVFVTIETYPEKNLRGCIGYPDAILAL